MTNLEQLAARVAAQEAEAKEKRRDGAVQEALSNYRFRGPAYKDLMITKLKTEIDYAPDGRLLAFGVLPVADHVRSVMHQHSNLLDSTARAAAPTLEDIKPGMSEEEYRRVAAHIVEALNNT